jgi:predicted O-methyltransferase YrrM
MEMPGDSRPPFAFLESSMAAESFKTWFGCRFAGKKPPSQLSDAERTALAKHAAGRKRIVEIGVYFGASTKLLRSVMAPDGEIVGIDPFFRGRLGVPFQKWVAKREVAKPANGSARLIKAFSQDAVRTWTAPIDFLFIDADHTWKGIDRDWNDWSKFIQPGGIVALHDSFSLPGRPDEDSVRYYAERIAKDSRFKEVERADSLAVVKRVTPS